MRHLIHILIAAPGQIHDDDLAFLESGGQLHDFRDRMRTFQCRNDAFFRHKRSKAAIASSVAEVYRTRPVSYKWLCSGLIAA